MPTAICPTCKGNEFKSGLHVVVCPQCHDDGEIEATPCYTCGLAITTQHFTMPKFTNSNVELHFCSQKCVDNYEENGYMEGEEDYYAGEREVDSDPYD